jgi:protein SCO1
MNTRSFAFGAAALSCMLLFCASARGQLQTSQTLSTQDEIRQSYLAQNLGSQIPLDVLFADDLGQAVRLGDYFGRVPTLLVLGYFTCPDLCPMTFRHLTEELNGIAPVVGRDFQVIIISFDPRDTAALAAEQKRSCLRAYKWPQQADGFHILTGHQDAIDAVARAVGFHFTFDQPQGRFVHPAGVMVLSPGGRLTHYFFGIDASPVDMESALHDAAAGRATAVDQHDQQYCVDYDPTVSPRGRWITRILYSACIAWAGSLFGYIGFKLVGDFSRRKLHPIAAPRAQEVES